MTLDVPDRIAEAIRSAGLNVERRILEMLVLDGYRTGELSRGEASQMFYISFQDTEEVLGRGGAELALSVTEHEQQSAAFRQARERCVSLCSSDVIIYLMAIP